MGFTVSQDFRTPGIGLSGSYVIASPCKSAGQLRCRYRNRETADARRPSLPVAGKATSIRSIASRSVNTLPECWRDSPFTGATHAGHVLKPTTSPHSFRTVTCTSPAGAGARGIEQRVQIFQGRIAHATDSGWKIGHRHWMRMGLGKAPPLRSNPRGRPAGPKPASNPTNFCGGHSSRQIAVYSLPPAERQPPPAWQACGGLRPLPKPPSTESVTNFRRETRIRSLSDLDD